MGASQNGNVQRSTFNNPNKKRDFLISSAKARWYISGCRGPHNTLASGSQLSLDPTVDMMHVLSSPIAPIHHTRCLWKPVVPLRIQQQVADLGKRVRERLHACARSRNISLTCFPQTPDTRQPCSHTGLSADGTLVQGRSGRESVRIQNEQLSRVPIRTRGEMIEY